jgi:molybdopterin synthase sulfur carrier subunit
VKLRLLYFAWVRERIGTAEETLDLPATIMTPQDLVAHLGASPRYAPLADTRRLRVAINQETAKWDAALADGDEVAFFPPATGG